MKNKQHLRALGVAIILILIISGVYYISRTQQPVTESMNEPPQEQSNDSEQSEMTEGSVSGVESGNDIEGNTGEDNNVQTPSIDITPYTVFLGFTEDFDIASEPASGKVDKAVVGYEWEAIFPSPLFATISLPAWDTSGTTYTVSTWNEDTASYEHLGQFPAGEEIEFPREGFLGARKFKVTGIDPALRICPGDRVFTWDARFTFEGDIGLIRTPITENLPDGETCQIR